MHQFASRISLKSARMALLSVGCAAFMAQAHAADVRERTRIVEGTGTGTGTGVTSAQAGDITLTLTEAAYRPIQSLIRSAGAIDKTSKTVTVRLNVHDAQQVQLGQRMRGFPVNGRTRMHQGRVTAISLQAGGAVVVATLSGDIEPNGAARYLVEIVTEQGPHLSVPNVSIIDDAPQRVVYLQRPSGELLRKVIRTGLEGELYTQVLEGLDDGDRVVSIGSFFVDAEHQLSAAGAAAMLGICTTTPGLELGSLQSSGLGRKARLAAYQSQVSEALERQK